ncbi:MAG TPA: TIM-barrel domain-containing protein [Myxococcales bacterium]|jgi:alpha-glucosidase
MRAAPVLLLSACSLAVLCACPTTPEAGPDAAVSVPADASVPPDASAPPPGPDASLPAPCDGTSRPSWVETTADQRFLFRCGATVLDLTVFDEGTVRLRYQAEGKPDRSFAVVGAPLVATTRAGGAEDLFGICTDALTVHVFPDCRVRATQADGTVVLEDPEGGGYFENVSGLRGVKRSLRADEHLFGLGEKTGPLDKRGLSLTMRNTDAFDSAWEGFAPGGDPLYQSVPFYVGLVGSSAYGLFTDNTWRTRFDLGASDPALALVSADGGVIDQYLFAGPTMADVLRRYTRLTGRMPLPPRWTLGYHQSRWGYSPDTEVLAIAQKLRSERIPADGLWLDIQHMDGFRSFTWDPTNFANPTSLVASLEALGFKTTTIIDPGIKVDEAWATYTQGVAGGHFLLGADGKPFVGEVWPGAAAFPDFSASATREWWKTLLSPNVKLGIRGLWIDMNEPASFIVADGRTVPDTVAANGDGTATTMAEIHNAYALLEAKATWEGMKAAQPDRRPFVLTRAGYAGEQRYVAVWTGDAPSQWQTLQETVPMLLNLGLSGVPFVGSDVGGYAGRATPEMFARWMQVGAVSPFFRGHTQNTGARQEPWMFGTEVEDISRGEIQRRYEMLPYLYSLFREAGLSGAPILRPLVYEFPADPLTHTLGDELLVGPWLLVAPVLEAGATTRSVYLPAGRWFETLSGAVTEGPATLETGLVLAARPTYVREGAILPHAEFTQYVGEKALTALELDVYPAATATTFALFEDEGDGFAYETGKSASVVFTAQRTATGATLSAAAREGTFDPGARTLFVRVRRVDHSPTAITLDGTALSSQASESALRTAKTGWFWDSSDLSLLIAFADKAAGFSLSMTYDPSLIEAAKVAVPFEVTLPAGTPSDKPICIASSASGWSHEPLTWAEPGVRAVGSIQVPRGEWFFYKVTRCDWNTAEMWPGCVVATNRYGFGAARPARSDSVAGWDDWCP